jgi:hypothetical protein
MDRNNCLPATASPLLARSISTSSVDGSLAPESPLMRPAPWVLSTPPIRVQSGHISTPFHPFALDLSKPPG